MPGNPKECREHAANCKRLAAEAVRPVTREYFVGLAAQWERLAAELESAEVFRRTIEDIEAKKLSLLLLAVSHPESHALLLRP